MNSSDNLVNLYINKAKTEDIIKELMTRNHISKKKAYKIIKDEGYQYNNYAKMWTPISYTNDNQGAWEFLFDYLIENYNGIYDYLEGKNIVDQNIINLLYQTIKLNFNIAHDIRKEKEYRDLIAIARKVKM